MLTEPRVADQFESAAQQRDAATLGMWIFLATEVLFFGGLFLGYIVFRISHRADFLAASNHTLVAYGTVNTAIILISSFVMVLAVSAAERQNRRQLCARLTLTAGLGLAFLTVKGFEYAHEIHEGLFPGRGFHFEHATPQFAEMFFYLYFLMTGVHALHIAIGIGLLTYFSVRSLLAANVSTVATGVELVGLYWHFVDIVWVFLFPLFYLAGRST